MAEFLDHLQCVPYVTPAEVLACCPAATDAGILPNDPRLIDAIEDASTILYYLTGRTFSGTCEAAIRPCLPCECGEQDCCCSRDAINVGTLWPVTRIVEVWFDGQQWDPNEFHVDEWNLLVRNCGLPWPRCTDLTAPPPYCDSCADCDGCGCTFEIIVEHGIGVPRILTRAARDLACTLLSASCLGDTCRLPEKVTSLSRRGLTMEINNPLEYLDRGMTGIYTVDLAIKTLNPTRLQSPSFVWSPDLKSNRVHRTYV